jgi:hypothetical protein
MPYICLTKPRLRSDWLQVPQLFVGSHYLSYVPKVRVADGSRLERAFRWVYRIGLLFRNLQAILILHTKYRVIQIGEFGKIYHLGLLLPSQAHNWFTFTGVSGGWFIGGTIENITTMASQSDRSRLTSLFRLCSSAYLVLVCTSRMTQ